MNAPAAEVVQQGFAAQVCPDCGFLVPLEWWVAVDASRKFGQANCFCDCGFYATVEVVAVDFS